MRASIRNVIPAMLLGCACLAATAAAQSMDELNLQLHGYATQGLTYTSSNNWNLGDTSSGSAAWTEAVVNLTTQPQAKLSIGMQTRYFLLGDYGNQIVLDWAQADYKVNDRFGIRAGKVKSPIGLLNETQDIDPAHVWVLLPQSIYPIASRNSLLSHYGASVYGSVSLGERLGKLEYRAFGGERIIAANDGLLESAREAGLVFPNGTSGITKGLTLHWKPRVPGLLLGATAHAEGLTGSILAGSLRGTYNSSHFNDFAYFGQYEHGKLMVAGEYNRLALTANTQLPGLPTFYMPLDERCWYAMTTYKLASRLTAGTYYSYLLDRKAAYTSSRYQKDWTFSARFDATSYLYLKAEQHIVNGTAVGFSSTDNLAGLTPRFGMTMVKLGVNF